MTEIIVHTARPKVGIRMCERLGDFFGEDCIGDLTGQRQREFAKQRGSQSAARRELETLAAAINHHVRDMVGGVQTRFRAVLPDAPAARERWLTRSEAAKLLNTARRDPYWRHIARFILVGLYTGTRAGAICGAALMPTIGRGYVDLEAGQFIRLAYGKKQSNKRQPTVDLPPRLLAHIRRWHRLGISTHAVVEFRGRPIKSVKNGWLNLVATAGLATDIKERKVIPHTLRHTAISWYLRAGVPVDQVSDYCGVSVPVLKKVYAHHIPGWSNGILAASQRFGRATDTQQKQVKRT
jgi:integrase